MKIVENVIMLNFKWFQTQRNLEFGIDFRGRNSEQRHEINDIFTRHCRDLIVIAPFSNQIGTAVAADVERIGVLESGPAVVTPNAQM